MDALRQNGIAEVTELESDFSYEQAKKVAAEYLGKHVPDMFICATDNMAFGTYMALQNKGLKVPKDVSLSGFGGYQYSEMIDPKLTTIRFHNEELGKLAAEEILNMIEEKPVQKDITVGYDFIEGSSVKNMNRDKNQKQK